MRGARSSRFASNSLVLSDACSKATSRCKSAGAAIQFYGMPANVWRLRPPQTRNRRSSVVLPLVRIDFLPGWLRVNSVHYRQRGQESHRGLAAAAPFGGAAAEAVPEPAGKSAQA